MSKTCFGKELCSTLFIIAGKPVPFETLPGNHGVIALESPKDDTLIAALNNAADKRVGGVYRMTEEEFSQKKTRAASMPLTQPRRKEMLRPMPKPSFQKRPSPAPANPGAPVVNAVPPRPETLPVTNSALKQVQTPGNAPVLHAPVPPFPTSAPAPATPPVTTAADAPVEGFRPATRRIKRRATAETAA